MSASTSSADQLPSWRVAVGLFATVVGYLIILLGVVLYTWDGLHYYRGIPILLVSVVGIVIAVGGGWLIWVERA